MNFVESLRMFHVDAKEIPCVTGKGAPTEKTLGAPGVLYMDTDTGDLYKCRAADAVNKVYTWEKIGGGSSDYKLPIGGENLGGVKNGGNVVINEDGTMTAPIPDSSQNGGFVAQPEAPENTELLWIDTDDEGGGDGIPSGTPGGYYTPTVTQPNANTMQVTYTPSAEGMPAVAPVQVALPTGAPGQPGTPGTTPHIGANGNWWIGETDTGVSATGSGSGGSGSVSAGGWEKIIDYTTTEQVFTMTTARLAFDSTADGSPLNEKCLIVNIAGMITNTADTDSLVLFGINADQGNHHHTAVTANAYNSVWYVVVVDDKYHKASVFYKSGNNYTSAIDKNDMDAITALYIRGNNANKTHLEPGAVIRVWRWNA